MTLHSYHLKAKMETEFYSELQGLVYHPNNATIKQKDGNNILCDTQGNPLVVRIKWASKN